MNGLFENQSALGQLSDCFPSLQFLYSYWRSPISPRDTHPSPDYSHLPYSIPTSHPTAMPLIHHHAAHLLLTPSIILRHSAHLPLSCSGEWDQYVLISLSNTAAGRLAAWVSSKKAACTLWPGDRPWRWQTISINWVKSTCFPSAAVQSCLQAACNKCLL